MSTEAVEQTLVLIKPDALKLSLTGYLLSQLSEFHTGLRLGALKIVQVSGMLAAEHYAEHRGKFFYPPLIDYIRGKLHYPDDPAKRRVVAIVYSGPDAVKLIRKIAGPTNPHVARDAAPGTVRALGTVVPVKDASGALIGDRMDNLIHASAAPDEAEREIKLWFEPRDIAPYMRAYPTTTCDAYFYYRDGALLLEHAPGSICLLAPGQKVWVSDLAALRALTQGQPASTPLDSVAAKYLINREPEPD
jgi:nucleoside-diphosphate kinase